MSDENDYDAFGLDGIDDAAPSTDLGFEHVEDVFDAAAAEIAGPVDAGSEDAFGLGFENETVSSPAGSNEAYATWEAEHKKALIAKAERIRAEKKANEAQAKKDLDAFYAKHKATLSTSQSESVSAEEKAKKSAKDTTEKGSQWEKVARYCDLKPRAESGKGSQQKKNERMRSLLVNLKNEEKK